MITIEKILQDCQIKLGERNLRFNSEYNCYMNCTSYKRIYLTTSDYYGLTKLTITYKFYSTNAETNVNMSIDVLIDRENECTYYDDKLQEIGQAINYLVDIMYNSFISL